MASENFPRVRVVHPEGGALMTKQSMAAETDINQIVARHVAHGAPFFEDGRATYGDFTGVDSYHEALNSLNRAQDDFAKLPASIRDHVGNDPGEFLEMVFNPARRQELVDLGLVEAAVPVAAPATPEEPIAGAVGAPGGAVAGAP